MIPNELSYISSNENFNFNTKSIVTYGPIKHEKKSFGLMLLRKPMNSNTHDLLLGKSAISYAFIEIVFGRYMLYATPETMMHIIYSLINNITPEEKRIFCTFDFPYMYFYVSGKKYDNIFVERLAIHQQQEYKSYMVAYKIFDRNILNYKDKILEYANQSYNKHVNLWQIPKGRMIQGETEIDCAVREFEEETGVSPSNYTLLVDVRPLVVETIIVNTKYICKYFIAVLNNNVSPTLKYRSKPDFVEITDIRWVNRDKLELYISNEYTRKAIKKIIKNVKAKQKRMRYINGPTKSQIRSSNDH